MMHLNIYQNLIQNLPVAEQTFSAKRSTWENIAETVSDHKDLILNLFKDQPTLRLSRADLFATENTTELLIKIIIWGYPRGMRGQHFKTICQDMPSLTSICTKFRNKSIKAADFRDHLLPKFTKVKGLGISTYSKFLYFLRVKIEGNPALILDERLIRVFKDQRFVEFKSLAKMRTHNAYKQYLDYLDLMDQQAQALDIKGENIEQFLFLFGNNLKASAL